LSFIPARTTEKVRFDELEIDAIETAGCLAHR
jgi:hypothetical protein